jgi:hypothetical protein
MSIFTIVGVIVGAWAMLSLVGAERQQGLTECRRRAVLDAVKAAKAADASAQAAQATAAAAAAKTPPAQAKPAAPTAKIAARPTPAPAKKR